jgi:hypothetical protein
MFHPTEFWRAGALLLFSGGHREIIVYYLLIWSRGITIVYLFFPVLRSRGVRCSKQPRLVVVDDDVL